MSAAFLAGAIATGRAMITPDGSIYVRHPTVMGWSPFKKVGRIVKRTGRAVGRTARGGARGGVRLVAKGGRAVGRGARVAARAVKRGAMSTARAAAQLGKLSAKGLLLVARAIASAAATPIRLAFARLIARPRANAIARSHGRRSPNAADKRAAIAWGLATIKRRIPVLGHVTAKILTFTRGVALAGSQAEAEQIMADADAMGAVDPATITAYATAAISAMTALAAGLKVAQGLRAAVAPGAAAPDTVPGEMPPGVIPGESYSTAAPEYMPQAEAAPDQAAGWAWT